MHHGAVLLDVPFPLQALRSSFVRLAGAFTLAPLPYALDALEPHISARTLQYHYGMESRHQELYYACVHNVKELCSLECD